MPKKIQGRNLILRALRHQNYRLFFYGQAVSLIGTWVQQLAMSWLVYRLTGSAFLLGAVGFADKIPAFFITPFAGVWLDRADRRRIILVTQFLLLLQALAMGALTVTGKIQVWQILVLSAFMGLVNALDIPARQAFVADIIDDKNDLGNAIALNSSLFNGARLIGPSIGGVLIALTSESFCFFVNAASFLGALAALSVLRLSPRPPRPQAGRVLDAFRQGFVYAFGFPPTRAILVFLALVSLAGMPYIVLLPVFAKDVLLGGAHTLGFLMAATGLGALAGAVYLASRKSVLGLGRWIAVSSALFGAGVIAFSFSSVLWLSLGLLVLTGFGMMIHMASSNTVLQTIVDDDKRGRVMSFYVASITGMAPFGSLLAGTLAGRIGAPATVRLGGCCCLAASALFTLQLPSIRKIVRPLYVKMGILPKELPSIRSALETTAGLETLEE